MEHAPEEGPFVSFTDLFIGILFLFLILVAALMLMHEETVHVAESEARTINEATHDVQMRRLSEQNRRMSEHVQRMQAKLDAVTKRDTDHPPFRLAIVYNFYQRASFSRTDWTYSRTVQVFRSPNGLCLNNVIMRSNLNLTWKPPIDAENIPTADNQAYVRMGRPCTLSAEGEQWNTDSETGLVNRVAEDIYIGHSALHKKEGDDLLEIQYRILGIYDDYFR